MSDLLPRAVEYYTLEDTLQPMPFNVSNPVLYYNRTIFEAAGLDPDDPPETLEELREASQAIVDSGAATYGIALETGFDSFGGWVTEQWFAARASSSPTTTTGAAARATEALFDSEFGVETYTFLQDLVADGLAVNVGENPDGLDALLKMADANEPAAMAIYTSAGVSSVLGFLSSGQVPGLGPDELGIGRLPSGGGVTVGGASLWMVADQPDEQLAATWDFIEYLVSAEAQSQWAAGTGYVPVNTGALEVAPLSDTYATDPRFRVALRPAPRRRDHARHRRARARPARRDPGHRRLGPAGHPQRRRRPRRGARRRQGRGRHPHRGLRHPHRHRLSPGVLAGSGAGAAGLPGRPGVADHVVEVVRGRPAEVGGGEGRVGDDAGRVARPAGAELRLEVDAEHPLDGVEHLEHRDARCRCRCCRRARRSTPSSRRAAASTWASARSPTWM